MRYCGWIVPGGLFGLAAGAAVHQIAFAVHTGAYGPRNEVRVARPTFRWEVWSNDPAAAVRGAEFTLDGQTFTGTYDHALRCVTFRPEHPLSTGPHHVICRVSFNNDNHYDRTWDVKVSTSPMQTLPPPDAGQLEALAAVNEIRRRYELPPARLDDALDFAALSHSKYLALNQTTGHAEESGKQGFSGASGRDRVSALGWPGGSWEDVSYGAKSPHESVADLFDAPYHRVPFLQVGTPVIGVGFSDDRFTIEFGQTSETGTAVSPPDGATGVPCAWHNFERPSPVRMHADASKVTGYPIVIAHFAPGLPHLTKMFGWLTGPDTVDIPCWINTPLNDDSLTCAAILIPKEPLRPNTRYRVGFDGRDATGATVRRETSFTTGA
jgi:hypothetical protein